MLKWFFSGVALGRESWGKDSISITWNGPAAASHKGELLSGSSTEILFPRAAFVAAVNIELVLASTEQRKQIQQNLHPDRGSTRLMDGEPFGVDKVSSERFHAWLWHSASERL